MIKSRGAATSTVVRQGGLAHRTMEMVNTMWHPLRQNRRAGGEGNAQLVPEEEIEEGWLPT